MMILIDVLLSVCLSAGSLELVSSFDKFERTSHRRSNALGNFIKQLTGARLLQNYYYNNYYYYFFIFVIHLHICATNCRTFIYVLRKHTHTHTYTTHNAQKTRGELCA